MRRFFQSTSGLLWVALLALLIVRTSDAHVHLCLDGQERRSTVHVNESAGACHDEGGSQHNDKDVSVFGGALAKKSAGADALDIPSAISVLLFILPPSEHIAVVYETGDDPAPKLPDLFLPLLRGPPV